MSTIGVGKAFRDQDRAARQGRRDTWQRASGTSDLPELHGAVGCAGCGFDVPRSDVLFGDAGGLCPSCFGDEASRSAEALVPSTGRLALGRLLRPLPLILATALLGWVVAGLFDPATLGYGTLKSLVGWSVLVGSLSLVGSVGSMQAVRDWLTAARPSVVDGSRDDAAVVWTGLATVGWVAPTLVLAWLAVWPWWA